jgi:hypothetical protein
VFVIPGLLAVDSHDDGLLPLVQCIVVYFIRVSFSVHQIKTYSGCVEICF